GVGEGATVGVAVGGSGVSVARGVGDGVKVALGSGVAVKRGVKLTIGLTVRVGRLATSPPSTVGAVESGPASWQAAASNATTSISAAIIQRFRVFIGHISPEKLLAARQWHAVNGRQ